MHLARFMPKLLTEWWMGSDLQAAVCSLIYSLLIYLVVTLWHALLGTSYTVVSKLERVWFIVSWVIGQTGFTPENTKINISANCAKCYEGKKPRCCESEYLQVLILFWVRKGLFEETTFKMRLEEWDGAARTWVEGWVDNVPGRWLQESLQAVSWRHWYNCCFCTAKPINLWIQIRRI